MREEQHMKKALTLLLLLPSFTYCRWYHGLGDTAATIAGAEAGEIAGVAALGAGAIPGVIGRGMAAGKAVK